MPATAGGSETQTARRQQCADAVLMVRPQAFGFNAETAASNTFQQPPKSGSGDANAAACAEFEQLAQALRSEGVTVCTVDDSATPAKPDAVFPNNWLSLHADGTLVLYPMAAANRRAERRQEAIDAAIAAVGFRLRHLIDLTYYEDEGKFLEGTGSLVLDHCEQVAYACLSPRTHPEVLAD